MNDNDDVGISVRNVGKSDTSDSGISAKGTNQTRGSQKPASSSPNQEDTTQSTDSNQSGSSDNGAKMIAGAILLAAGGLISITGIGLFIGVPMAMLGVGLMFPRFAAVMVLLAVFAFLMLLFAL